MVSLPLVSVILPVYNAELYIRTAVLSVTHQSYKNIEIIIIDDGSSDKSLPILEDLKRLDNRIRLVSRENRGLVATLNEGLSMASGKLIARMDADDIAYPDRIERQVGAFQDYPTLCMVGMHADFLFSNNRVLRTSAPILSQDDIKIRNIFDCFFIHPTVMLNKDIILSNNLTYRSSYIHSEDFDLWRRITARYPVTFINMPGLAWRQGHSSVRQRHFAEQCLSHARIVGEQLEAYEIIPNGQIFISSIQDGDLGGTIDVLLSVRQYIMSLSKDRNAFENAFALFVGWVFSATAQTHPPHIIFQRLKKEGFGHLVPSRHRLWATVSRITPPALAYRIVETSRNAYRYSNSISIECATMLPFTIT